jgi:hypothetical protein
MALDRIGICGTAVAEHVSGMIGWGATQQECDGIKDAQARGTGKVPSFKGRKAYLSRCCTTRRAKSCQRLSRGCLCGMDQPWASFCVHRCTCGTCVCADETGDASQQHIHCMIRSVSHGVTQRESLGDSPKDPRTFTKSQSLLGEAKDYYDPGPMPGGYDVVSTS